MKFESLKLILLFNLLSLTITAQNNSPFEWPKNEITPIFKEFLIAYNSNDLQILESFTDKFYAKNDKEAAVYWKGIFLEYGEIEPFSIAKEYSNENNQGIFFRGKHTKSWVMIMLRMNADNTKVIGKTVGRGMLPSGNISSAYNPVSSKELVPYLEKYLEGLDKTDYFSGSVLVAKGDSILFEKTYGLRDKQKGNKIDTNTTFNVASTTKTFTAIAIAQLVEQGKLNYSDPISKLIPEYPKDIADQVTIHHLLTHTSGIELDDYKPFNMDNDSAKSMNDFLSAQIKHIDSLNEGRRKNFKVLNKFDYSNENFALLGVIIERISKMSYAEYVEKNIFTPLHMRNSFADVNKVSNHNNVATGYSYYDSNDKLIDGTRHEAQTEDYYLSPFGGIYSTTRDLYTYLKAINKHTLVNKDTQELLHQKQAKRFETDNLSMHYGYGFYIIKKVETVSVGHGGTYHGVGSHCYYYPETDHYIIVLSNYGAIFSNTVAIHIESLIGLNN
ncbi:beta-lactamase family protein [Flavobacteriaceae bacterium S0862]|nr:beta-lactamase family protein [Flavobacteriaceae bacterium S0862]